VEENESQVTIITNIHNEKLLELEIAELRSREEIYSQLVSNSSDPVITFDAERGTVVSINRAAERAFQYPAAEILGKSINALLPQVHPSSFPITLLTSPFALPLTYPTLSELLFAWSYRNARDVHAQRRAWALRHSGRE
jgi:PAS domain-containing protein